jgi:hypothetical protein
MPYIPVARQAALANHEVLPENVGELTYQLTMTIQEYLLKHGLRYQQVAEISGALHQCQRDFDERVVEPYEALKRHENGDVWRDIFTNHGGTHIPQWQFP